jgi:hypothetical protein
VSERSVAQAPVREATPAQPAVLQRACACGQHTHGGGECAECKKKGQLQRKLAVGASNDPLEREADRVANQVLAAPARTGISDAPPRIQRYAGQATEGSDTAPASVDGVLASPGRPLEPALRQDMEQRFGHDFGRIRIHTDLYAARAAAALGAEAFAVGHHIAFAREHFLPGTAYGKRLVAHELTHAIQQAATSPYVALSPEKKQAGPTPASSKFDGALLGSDRNDKEILVKREVGGTQGYDDRLQAIAVARLAQAEPSAVALGKDGKWHAFETTTGINPADASANDPRASKNAAGVPFKEVHILPSRTGIGQSRQKVDELKAKSVRLDNLESAWRTDPEFRKAVKGSDRPFLEVIQEEREQTTRNLNQATQTSAALIFGVSESEIQLNRSSFDRKSGKINLNPRLVKDAKAAGLHGAEAHQSEDFEPGMRTAIEIDLGGLDKPAGAQATMFHEVSHLKDFELAQHWVKTYEEETKHTFVGGPGLKFFKEWIDALAAQARPRISKADAELVIDLAANASVSTEARANVHTFLTALQVGAADLATEALVNYAHALRPKKEGGSGRYASPLKGSQVQAALVKELKTAYGLMPKTMKQQYDDAVAAARKEYPSAWISELDFSKRAGR